MEEKDKNEKKAKKSEGLTFFSSVLRTFRAKTERPSLRLTSLLHPLLASRSRNWSAFSDSFTLRGVYWRSNRFHGASSAVCLNGRVLMRRVDGRVVFVLAVVLGALFLPGMCSLDSLRGR